MRTFAVDATYDHDWLHFLVKADYREEALNIVKKYFEFNSTESIKYKLENHSNEYPEIVHFFYDEDDIEVGVEEFQVNEYLGDITVVDNYGHTVDFTTLEDASDYVLNLLKFCGSNFHVKKEEYRGLRFLIVDNK